MKRAVDGDSQSYLHWPRRPEPVKTDKSVCDVVRSLKTGSQPSQLALKIVRYLLCDVISILCVSRKAAVCVK